MKKIIGYMIIIGAVIIHAIGSPIHGYLERRKLRKFVARANKMKEDFNAHVAGGER